MVALSTVRSSSTNFPFVNELQSLTQDARSILGAACKLTYAADWTEYHGYQPADTPGDKLFHLDSLWADPNIDAVGIDNYMPLADWRDFGANEDYTNHDITQDLDYLKSNIAGGEGFDWFYASDADRANQTRSPISDSAHGEPWVWRYKDLKNWWMNPHHNRIGGVRQSVPTSWQPQGKPFWLTEVGCGAVGNGANQPNAFTDPKSVENKSPYHSDGLSEPSIQRQFLRAHYDHWQNEHDAFEADQNPLSSLYEGRMLDADRIYLWAWDARPFPAFPLRNDVWSDSPSYFTGHWTTGRFGCATVSEITVSVAKDIGVQLSNEDSAPSFIEGCLIGSPTSARNDIELLLKTDELLIRDGPDGLSLDRIRENKLHVIDESRCVVTESGIFERSHQDRGERIRSVNVNYADRLSDYDNVSAFQTNVEQDGAVAAIGLPFTLDSRTATRIASVQLQQAQETTKTVQFALPLSDLSFEVGDVITLRDDPHNYAISKIVDGVRREITARSLVTKREVLTATEVDRPSVGVVVGPAAVPITYVAQVPPSDNNETAARLIVGSYAKPWPGKVTIIDDAQNPLVSLQGPAPIGRLVSELPSSSLLPTWDTETKLDIELFYGHVSSLDRKRVLSGENRLLVRNTGGCWEEIGFASAALIAPKKYRLTTLIRGQGKTEFASTFSAPPDAEVMLMSGSTLLNTNLEIGTLAAISGATNASNDIVMSSISESPNLPLAPTHLNALKHSNGDVHLSWKRRSQLSGNMWLTGDVPSETNVSSCLVEIFNEDTKARESEVTSDGYNYTAAQQVEDFGFQPNEFQFVVSQLSYTLVKGHSETGVYN